MTGTCSKRLCEKEAKRERKRRITEKEKKVKAMQVKQLERDAHVKQGRERERGAPRAL